MFVRAIYVADGEQVVAADADTRDLLKAHIKGYTRKDGAFIAEHDDNRQAASQSHGKSAKVSGDKLPSNVNKGPSTKLSDYRENQVNMPSHNKEMMAAFSMQHIGEMQFNPALHVMPINEAAKHSRPKEPGKHEFALAKDDGNNLVLLKVPHKGEAKTAWVYGKLQNGK